MYNGSGVDPVGVDQASTHITDLPHSAKDEEHGLPVEFFFFAGAVRA